MGRDESRTAIQLDTIINQLTRLIRLVSDEILVQENKANQELASVEYWKGKAIHSEQGRFLPRPVEREIPNGTETVYRLNLTRGEIEMLHAMLVKRHPDSTLTKNFGELRKSI